MGLRIGYSHTDFYPRSPCGERLFKGDHGHMSGDISIHALLAESDVRSFLAPFFIKEFLSTLSLRRATVIIGFFFLVFVISIHALLAESDY